MITAHAFNGAVSYSLLTPKDGIYVTMHDVSCTAILDRERIRTEIGLYVQPYATPDVVARPDLDEVIRYAAPYSADIAPVIQEHMPMTAAELVAVLGDYLRFSDGKKGDAGIRHVYDLLHNAVSLSTYPEQLRAVEDALAELSSTYSQVLALKRAGT